MKSDFTIPLADSRAALATTGGKGASLARLSSAGLPVPDGFHITTQAYRAFLTLNGLENSIKAALQPVNAMQTATLDAASEAIRAQFASAKIPPEVAGAITSAYDALAGVYPAVAVRSSATAEDLPDLSFAGQQETYLNIQGAEAVLEAVKRCWASLWTPRAIAYRMQNGIDHRSVQIAVVVQLLVPAEAAGILFTADPVTGQRDRVMISAAWGLGEAVVGGLVTPDTLIVDKETGRVIDRQTADKQVMTVRLDGRSEEQPVPEALRRAPVLDDRAGAQLAHLGGRIEDLYGMPVDIEWALADGKFAILQARPITALPEPGLTPPSSWPMPNPKARYFRSSLAEHLPNPVSPLFGTLGLRLANKASAELMKFMRADLPPSSDYRYLTINGYTFLSFAFDLKTSLAMTKLTVSQFGMVLRRGEVRWREARKALGEVVASWEARRLQGLSPSELLEGVQEVVSESMRFYTVIQSGTLPAASMSETLFTRLYNIIKRKGDPDATALLFGFDTAALQAEKSLFDLAVWVKEHPALRDYVLRTSSENLAADLQHGQPPEGVPAENWTEWMSRFEEHRDKFGRTSYEFDFMNPTPAEMPETYLDAVKMYLEGRGSNPYERQREAAEKRERVTREILGRSMWFPKAWFKKALNWAQETGPMREDSIADMGMGYPTIRRLLGALGERFVVGGAIESSGDIYWLVEDEMNELAARLENGEPLPDFRARIPARKAEWRAQLKAVPPVMLPVDSRWSKLMPGSRENESGPVLKGLGTSTGKVSAPARVLFGPEEFGKMKPGDVLVAVTTTPAWTPLFTMASAVVTDIGGPLSHSSIVAREYGIPAVMATGNATRRIHDGQMITVDGEAGVVMLDA